MADAYPLTWPAGWPRTDYFNRAHGRFGKRDKVGGQSWTRLREVTIHDGTQRVLAELDRMSASEVIVSTNLELRRDGLPRSNQRQPGDSGVAVYWTDRHGDSRCIAIDRYLKIADNLAAIAATLDAMRAIERHGGAEILDRAFTGFTALEGPTAAHWSVTLGIQRTAGRTAIDAAWRRLRGQLHPDRSSGDEEAFKRAAAAYETACREVAP